MPRNTADMGMVGHTSVLNRLVQLGYEVLLPWSDHLGYDLAYFVTEETRNFGFFVHRESYLVRIQCKVAWLTKDGGAIEFNTTTVSAGGRDMWKKKKSNYVGRAEYFGIYSPDTSKVYMMAVEEANKTSSQHLRLKAPKSGNQYGFKWAMDYEI